MKNFGKLMLALLLVAGATTLMAQPTPPAPGGSAIPIDGGLSALLAAGIGYGAYKLRGGKKSSANPEKETD